jgi:methylphosphotriester-DNA--protein-cysteine methyltransferase
MTETWRRFCDLRVRLRDRCEEPHRLDVVGDEVGLSPSRLLRRFRALFGTTPHALQSDERMARALLRSSKLSVTEGCLAVGFESPGSFSSAFSPGGVLATSVPGARGYRARSRLAARLLRADGLNARPDRRAISEKHRPAPRGRSSLDQEETPCGSPS